MQLVRHFPPGLGADNQGFEMDVPVGGPAAVGKGIDHQELAAGFEQGHGVVQDLFALGHGRERQAEEHGVHGLLQGEVPGVGAVEPGVVPAPPGRLAGGGRDHGLGKVHAQVLPSRSEALQDIGCHAARPAPHIEHRAPVRKAQVVPNQGVDVTDPAQGQEQGHAAIYGRGEVVAGLVGHVAEIHGVSFGMQGHI